MLSILMVMLLSCRLFSDGDAAFLQAILCVWALARSHITTMTTSDSLIIFSFRTLSTTMCNSFDSKVYKKCKSWCLDFIIMLLQ
jgi:hypothetical protein